MDAGTVAVARQIFDMYREYGDEDYIGEAVSVTAHCVQAAMLAESECQSREMILAAVLHDVGHLVGAANRMSAMVTNGVTLGTQEHDKVGADYLRQLGVPEPVCMLVSRHVDAKRYLVFKSPHYRECLSDASRMTLAHQGGEMTAEEAARFEHEPSFEAVLALRRYDELAKDPKVVMDPLSKYEAMLVDCMASYELA